MSREIKKKVTFAMTMGIVTTGIISFLLISINVGFTPSFMFIWLRSWLMSYSVAVPAIILISPKIQNAVDKLFE